MENKDYQTELQQDLIFYMDIIEKCMDMHLRITDNGSYIFKLKFIEWLHKNLDKTAEALMELNP